MRTMIFLILWVTASFAITSVLNEYLFYALIFATLMRLVLHRGNQKEAVVLTADQEAAKRGEATSLEFQIYRVADWALVIIWAAIGPAVLLSILGGLGGSDGAERCIPRGPCY